MEEAVREVVAMTGSGVSIDGACRLAARRHNVLRWELRFLAAERIRNSSGQAASLEGREHEGDITQAADVPVGGAGHRVGVPVDV